MKRKSEKQQSCFMMTLVICKLSELNIVTVQLNGEKQTFVLNKKDFKTGSRGYHTQGKMQIGEKRYQINILCVEIGSKPKDK